MGSRLPPLETTTAPTGLAILLGVVVLLPVFDQPAFALERGSYPLEIRARLRWQLSRSRVELFDDMRVGLWPMVAFGVRRWSLTMLAHGGVTSGGGRRLRSELRKR